MAQHWAVAQHWAIAQGLGTPDLDKRNRETDGKRCKYLRWTDLLTLWTDLSIVFCSSGASHRWEGEQLKHWQTSRQQDMFCSGPFSFHLLARDMQVKCYLAVGFWETKWLFHVKDIPAFSRSLTNIYKKPIWESSHSDHSWVTLTAVPNKMWVSFQGLSSVTIWYLGDRHFWLMKIWEVGVRLSSSLGARLFQEILQLLSLLQWELSLGTKLWTKHLVLNILLIVFQECTGSPSLKFVNLLTF